MLRLTPPPSAQGLSRVRDGLLIAEVDLNLCRQIKDKWCLAVCPGNGPCFPAIRSHTHPLSHTPQMTQRLDLYAKSFTAAAEPDYVRQTIRRGDAK